MLNTHLDLPSALYKGMRYKVSGTVAPCLGLVGLRGTGVELASGAAFVNERLCILPLEILRVT